MMSKTTWRMLQQTMRELFTPEISRIAISNEQL